MPTSSSSGDNHDYERFEPIGVTPQDTAAPNSSTTTGAPNFQQPKLDPDGIREFVVGTGGKNHYGFGSQPPLMGETIRDASTYGILEADNPSDLRPLAIRTPPIPVLGFASLTPGREAAIRADLRSAGASRRSQSSAGDPRS